MDYQQLRLIYSSSVKFLNQKIDELKIQISQERLNYIHELENLGLKPGAKVKVLVPENEYCLSYYDQTLFGYIDQILVSTTLYEYDNTGYVSLAITLPSKSGKQVMRGRQKTKEIKDRLSNYPFVQPEWVTILSEDFDFTKDPEAKRFLDLFYTS